MRQGRPPYFHAAEASLTAPAPNMLEYFMESLARSPLVQSERRGDYSHQGEYY
jgi:hypothetical protein